MRVHVRLSLSPLSLSLSLSLCASGSRPSPCARNAPGSHGVITSSADSCAACPNGTTAARFVAVDMFQAGGDVLGWEGDLPTLVVGPDALLGGYSQLSRGSYLRKTFSGLCTHRAMTLVFSLVPIGWQGESAMLYVDGVLVWSESSFSANTVLVVPHSERQMTVEFRTTISSGATGLNRSWGLSRFDAAAQCSGQVRDMLQWLLPCQTWVSSSPCSVS